MGFLVNYNRPFVEIPGSLLTKYDGLTVKINDNSLTSYYESMLQVHELDSTSQRWTSFNGSTTYLYWGTELNTLWASVVVLWVMVMDSKLKASLIKAFDIRGYRYR